jgi:hypothetical protein
MGVHAADSASREKPSFRVTANSHLTIDRVSFRGASTSAQYHAIRAGLAFTWCAWYGLLFVL